LSKRAQVEAGLELGLSTEKITAQTGVEARSSSS
jgi:hypothetical protein